MCLPHARGGVSLGTVEEGAQKKSSPRPWGCFQYFLHGLTASIVFPTPVGGFVLVEGKNSDAEIARVLKTILDAMQKEKK